MPNLQERFTGCLLGAAIGDALGMPMEDLTLEERDRYYGGEIRDFVTPHRDTPCGTLQAGQYTDDTQLLIATIESIIESKGFNPEHLSQRLIKWYLEEDEERYRGEATKQGIINLMNGVPWYEAGIDKTGCGAATRAVPFGLLYYKDTGKATEHARLAGSMTHKNALAQDGSSCVATCIALLTNGELPTIETLKNNTHTLDFKNKLDDVELCLRRGFGLREAIGVLGNSSVASETVGLVLFLFLRNPLNFEEVVRYAVNAATETKGGDTDSIGYLVGAMSGTYSGIQVIPQKWTQGVENASRLRKLARKLYLVAASKESS